DLVGPLGDDGEHDVHDDDAADDHEDGDDSHGGGGDGAGQLIPEIDQRIGSDHGESVVVFRTEVTVGTKESASFVLRLQKVCMVDGDGGVIHPITEAPGFEVGLGGDYDKVVLRLAENRDFGFCDADDFEGNALNGKCFSHRATGKQLVFYIAAEESDIHVAVIFDFGKEPSFIRFKIQNDADIGGSAHDLNTFGRIFAVVDGRSAIGHEADLA